MKTIRATGNNVSIHVNGVTLCYDDLGEGIIPVLFIHGFPFDKSSWQPQMEFFKRTHRVIAVDIRGFGKSTSNDEHAGMSLFADDLIKLLDALNIDKVIACGLSMGGYILLNAITRYPERFKAIVLSDTQCIADSPEGKEKRYKTIEQVKAGGFADFTDGVLKNIFCRETLESKRELVEKIKAVVLSTSTETITQTLHALAVRNETCSVLPEISVPALVLCGKEDVVTPPAQSELMLTQIKNATYHSIDNAGHLANFEQPVEFNRHLDNFISAFVK